MPRVFADVARREYRPRWKDYDAFERVDTVPDGMKWMPTQGAPQASANFTVLRTIGDYYRLIRNRATGEVAYFKRKVADAPATPAAKIDAEPEREKQVRYRKGTFCWFVDTDGRWYCCEVVDRQAPNTGDAAKRITIRSTTGFDAERVKAWPYGDLLEFPAKENNPLFLRLRPLKARRT